MPISSINDIDNMNAAYRNDVLKFGTTGSRRNWKMRSEKRSKRYTTRWDELPQAFCNRASL